MLHRVLPTEQLDEQGAIREWTLNENTFSDLLHFLNRNYNPISYLDLQRTNGNFKELPNRALLLTFDDGWQDNYKFALPLLLKHSMPAHIFIATDKIGSQRGFWQEKIVSACKRNPELLEKLLKTANFEQAPNDATQLIEYLSEMESVETNFADLFSILETHLPDNRQMLSEIEIISMSKHNITFGSHGASHSRLSKLSTTTGEQELQRSKHRLEDLLGRNIDSLSFPHGDFTDDILASCRDTGYKYLFTSIDGIKKGNGILIPRVHVSEAGITKNNSFCASSAAYYLFFRTRT